MSPVSFSAPTPSAEQKIAHLANKNALLMVVFWGKLAKLGVIPEKKAG